MKLEPTPINWVKSENMPKESVSRKRRLRKKLKVDEYAQHFIDVRFNISEMLTDEQMGELMQHPYVTFFCGTSNTLCVSIEADTTLMDFYLVMFGKSGYSMVTNHIRNRVDGVAEFLGSMTGYRYTSRISSIHFGDANYASEEYYDNTL